jgi:hypothetical protein
MKRKSRDESCGSFIGFAKLLQDANHRNTICAEQNLLTASLSDTKLQAQRVRPFMYFP